MCMCMCMYMLHVHVQYYGLYTRWWSDTTWLLGCTAIVQSGLVTPSGNKHVPTTGLRHVHIPQTHPYCAGNMLVQYTVPSVDTLLASLHEKYAWVLVSADTEVFSRLYQVSTHGCLAFTGKIGSGRLHHPYIHVQHIRTWSYIGSSTMGGGHLLGKYGTCNFEVQ